MVLAALEDDSLGKSTADIMEPMVVGVESPTANDIPNTNEYGSTTSITNTVDDNLSRGHRFKQTSTRLRDFDDGTVSIDRPSSLASHSLSPQRSLSSVYHKVNFKSCDVFLLTITIF